MMRLDTYHGMNVTIRRKIDWKAFILFSYDGLAQPYIGLNIDL